MSKKVVFVALALCGNLFAFDMNAFKEGFKIGQEFGRKEVAEYIQNLKEVVRIQRDILNGKLPACYIDKFGELKLLKPINLSRFSRIYRPGFYALWNLSDRPDWFKGYVVYFLRKNGYLPDFDRNKVWIRFDTQADALEALKLVREKLKIEGEIYKVD